MTYKAAIAVPKKRKTRRKNRRNYTWRWLRGAMRHPWVRIVTSLGVLTLWLKLNAHDFDKTEFRTLGLQAVTVLVVEMLGSRKS
jgi:hypothetical protein